jgi:hypothetical protein
MRANSKRLERLHGVITAAPVLRGVLDEAYEWFTMFGELPEDATDDHVALAVIHRPMNGGVDKPRHRPRTSSPNSFR